MQLLNHKDLHTITQAADGHPLHKQTSNDERSTNDLQIEQLPHGRIFAGRSARDPRYAAGDMQLAICSWHSPLEFPPAPSRH
jgi:hypothetical protein